MAIVNLTGKYFNIINSIIEWIYIFSWLLVTVDIVYKKYLLLATSCSTYEKGSICFLLG